MNDYIAASHTVSHHFRIKNKFDKFTPLVQFHLFRSFFDCLVEIRQYSQNVSDGLRKIGKKYQILR